MKIEDYWKPYHGAVSITFDDGTENQLQKAVPLMDRFALIEELTWQHQWEAMILKCC
jgi:hypothetical protein